MNPEWLEYHFSMVMHPDLDKPAFVTFAHDLQGPGVCEAMLEWLRLSYQRTEDLYTAMNRNQSMAKGLRGWYEAFRLQFLRGTGCAPTPVDWIEDRNLKVLASTSRDAIYKLEVMESEIEVRRRLVKALAHAGSNPNTENRMVWKHFPRLSRA